MFNLAAVLIVFTVAWKIMKRENEWRVGAEAPGCE